MKEQHVVSKGQGITVSAHEQLVFQLAESLRHQGYRVYGDAYEGASGSTEVRKDTVVLAFTRDKESEKTSFLRKLFLGQEKLLIGRVSIQRGLLTSNVSIYVQVYGRENLRKVAVWAEHFAQEHSHNAKISLATKELQYQDFPWSWFYDNGEPTGSSSCQSEDARLNARPTPSVMLASTR